MRKIHGNQTEEKRAGESEDDGGMINNPDQDSPSQAVSDVRTPDSSECDDDLKETNEQQFDLKSENVNTL